MGRINCFQLEITNNCNYKCAKCPRDPKLLTRDKGFIKIETVAKVLKLAKKYDAFINFSFFGEPLLHPEIFKILEMSRNHHVIMNSNISLLTIDTMEKFIKVGLNNLRVSIDASTSKTYDKVRPSLACLDMTGGIVKKNRLNAIDEKLKYWHELKDHCPTRHVFPVSSLNFHEVDSYVKKWKPMLSEIDEILIKSILTYGGKITDDLITPNPCNVWEQGVITVDWQGNVSMCNLDTNLNLSIGNLYKKSLEDMLDSPEYYSIKKASLKKIIYPCTKCVDSNNWSKNIKITKSKKWDVNRFKSIYGVKL